MRARRAGALALALALLAVAPAAAGSATPAPAPATPAPAPLPPELQALEAKMAQLQVVSERFSINGTITGTSEETSASGKCRPSQPCRVTRHTRVKRTRHRVDISQRGEVNLAEDAVALFSGGRRVLIAVGSALYLYAPGRTPRGRSRPWVRQTIPGVAGTPLAALLMPFHGPRPGEVSLGGSGPYAGLIDLLATAAGPIVAKGPATVAGQPTVQFSATVRPSLLVTALPPHELARLREVTPSQQIRVYLTESGLPLRVVATGRRVVTSIEIVSVNGPVDVKAPPPGRTRTPRGERAPAPSRSGP